MACNCAGRRAVVDREVDRASCRVGSVDGVAVGHRAQGGLVGRRGCAAGQRQNAGRSGVRTRDPISVREGEHVAGLDVGDRHRGRGQGRTVGIRHRQGRVDYHRGRGNVVAFNELTKINPNRNNWRNHDYSHPSDDSYDHPLACILVKLRHLLNFLNSVAILRLAVTTVQKNYVCNIFKYYIKYYNI